MSTSREDRPAGVHKLDEQTIIKRFIDVNRWRRRDVRAPHKPLLLLMALARIQRGEARLMPYFEVEAKLTELLQEFGPARKKQRPEYPFWRLQNDDQLWEIPERDALIAARGPDNGAGDMWVSLLRKHQAQGGLSEPIAAQLRGNVKLVHHIAGRLLENNFPPTTHDDILDAVGMPWVPMSTPRRRRDPRFRDAVLRIYEYRCAICGYAGKLGQRTLNLEAAHIRWHAENGPDDLDNGIAMCAFHHRAFDRGAIGLDDDYRITVSQEVHGGPHTETWLLNYNGKPIHGPQAGQPAPAHKYITWHNREVFRLPARSRA